VEERPGGSVGVLRTAQHQLAHRPLRSGRLDGRRQRIRGVGAGGGRGQLHRAAGLAGRGARPAPGPGTYRITIGYGGIGQLAGPAWSVDTRPVDLPAGARLAFSERLILDRQPNNEGIWFYVPKGRTHVDLEIIDRNPGAAQALVLYPDGPDGDPRTVVVNKPGTHRIPLEAGEAGKPVRFQPDPEPNVLNVPYFYGLPPIWARSPAALLIPHAVAAADGLTIID
jgi:hypothetical protein